MKTSSVISYLFGIISGAVSLFFLFYTIRLFIVTRGLTVINTGGQGAYIGAIVFPILAVIFGVATWFFLKSARSKSK